MDTPKKESIGFSLSKFDDLIDTLKKFSLLGGLLTGVGLAGCYFFGIAIYATYNAMLGIPPFDFSLQNCLEYGGASLVELVTVIPVLIFVGMVDNWKEANLAVVIFLGLPLFLGLLLWILGNRPGTRPRGIRHGVASVFLVLMSFDWIVLYVVLLSSMTTNDLLLDPA